MQNYWASASLVALAALQVCSAYDMVREYAGSSFFDRWDFYGSWDNLTLGDVWWLDEQDATQQGLVYINGAGNAIIKVDNTTTVPYNEKRNSVRITTRDFYNFGSLWITDITHLPFGCSVWPAFWSKGTLWPNDGEIDIMEAINLMSANQMALHTTYGCSHTTPLEQIGQSAGLDAGNVGGTGLNSDGEDASDCSTASGCTVAETKNASFGSAFASDGGGVWATQFDIAGVYIWYWPRSQIPASIRQATSTSSIDLSDWGSPSASYPNTSCTMENYFTPQQLVLDITLCGDWAGIGAVYNASCGNSGPTGLCYNDNVVGDGSNYAEAYFEVSYVRAYTTYAPGSTPTAVFDSAPTDVSGSTSSGAKEVCTRRADWVAYARVTVVLGALLGGMAVL